MTKFNLKAEKREVLGKKVKGLRRQGKIPANIYGKKVKSQAISISQDDFQKIFKEAGETSVVEVLLAKETIPTLIHNLQIHPVDEHLLHVDFLAVDLTEKVTAAVPIELIGVAPAEKEGIGVLVHLVDEIEVEALPTDLPDKLTVDISSLEKIDDSVTLKDIKVDKKIVLKAEEDLVIAKIEALREEEELPPAPAAEEETKEGEVEKPETEGEQKEEGGEKIEASESE